MNAIDWSALKPGDPDPEGLLNGKIVEICGQPSLMDRAPRWMCTRAIHLDDIHAAAGLKGVVLAVWGPHWQEEIDRG